MFPPSAVGTSEIPITIHYGPVMHQMRARALSAGAVGFLDKPFSEEGLLRAVQAALPSVRGDREGSPR